MCAGNAPKKSILACSTMTWKAGAQMILFDPPNREEWLRCRCLGIGGSDAGSVIGVNRYKSNVQLWQEKTGEYRPDDISDKPAVKYGKEAESHLRALFQLDFPEYSVDYHEFRMYADPQRPFAYATLDGELTDQDGRNGVLEIKTTTIQKSAQWSEWDGRIPDSYYVQILHQLACTGWDFAVLKAHIRHYKDGDLLASTRHYRINRQEVELDIQTLIQKETAFWECVTSKRKPPLILPEI